MKVEIIFSTRKPHRRTLKFNDVQPDPHSIITQIFEEVSQMAGPLWVKLNPPEDVVESLRAGHLVLSPVVVVDGEIFLVESDGKIVYALGNNEELVPGIEES